MMRKSILYQILFWLVFYLINTYSDSLWSSAPVNTVMLINVALAVIGSLLNMLIFISYLNLRKFIKNKRVVFLIVGILIFTFSYLWAYSNDVLWYFANNSTDPIPLHLFWKGHLYKSLKLNIFQCASLFVWIIADYMKTIQSKDEKIQEITKLSNEAQLKMLKYQLNPHFIFNALNNIQANIKSDPGLANTLLIELSNFFRYSLLKPTNDFVKISEEIEAVKHYVVIQKERFKDNFEVNYTINTPEDIEIPFFIIIPLVENAIKHGIKTTAKKFILWVSIVYGNDQLKIKIENTGILRHSTESKANSTNTGISNLKNRLELIYNNSSSFSLSEKENIVTAEIIIDFAR